MNVTAIKCLDCGIVFRKTKDRISFELDDKAPCPFCGVISVNGVKVLEEIKVNESELTTND